MLLKNGCFPYNGHLPLIGDFLSNLVDVGSNPTLVDFLEKKKIASIHSLPQVYDRP